MCVRGGGGGGGRGIISFNSNLTLSGPGFFWLPGTGGGSESARGQEI